MPPTPSSAAPARPWWVWLNITGLDAVLAALLWLPLFARASGAHLIRAEYVVLGCAVWCVYAADRMLDGLMRNGLRGDRHRFAASRWLLLSAGIVAATGVAGWLLAFHVREIVGVWGLKLAVAVAVYFAITWFSRQPWSGLVGAASLGGLIAVGLMQGSIGGEVWPHAWRGVLAGFLLTVLILSVRHPGLPAPWTLPRKLLGGWLFAMGTALAPFAHLEMAAQLLTGGSVLLFGVVCGLNSLGIRLWETTEPDLEHALLGKLYPFMLMTAAAGAGTEWLIADKWSRPLLAACGLASVLLLLVHLFRNRMPASLRPLLADGAMIVAAAAMLLYPVS